MALPKFAVSIFSGSKRGYGTHVLEAYHAENEVIAAYMVLANNFEFEFPDNDDRSEYDIDEAIAEFDDYGFSLQVIQI